MNKVRICPACGHKSEVASERCPRCYAPFNAGDTVLIAEAPPEVKTLRRAKPVTRLQVDTIALYVMGEVQPILVRREDTIVLGRPNSDTEVTLIDLSPYRASLLGVSRQHAAIHFRNGEYYIEDLGSTNGTWLNQKRLVPHTPHPLSSGDQVRLGHLLIYTHFHSLQPAN